jgi:7-cyano-7-deazaguanine synthase
MGIHEILLKVVVLSSGGVDSSTTMLLLKKEDHDVHPVHVNYGQRAESHEWDSCQRICKHLQVSDPIRINISGLGVIPSSLLRRDLDIEKDAFLPTRNLMFVVIGAAYAFSIGCEVVALGILANPIFPDQKPEFFELAETCVTAALGRRMRVITPLIKLDKRETLKLAKKYSLPLEITYHCHAGTDSPCGKCISCKERIAAEEMLRTEDADQAKSFS